MIFLSQLNFTDGTAITKNDKSNDNVEDFTR